MLRALPVLVKTKIIDEDVKIDIQEYKSGFSYNIGHHTNPKKLINMSKKKLDALLEKFKERKLYKIGI